MNTALTSPPVAIDDFKHQHRKMVFNPERDLKPVSPYGYVDLKELAANNSIPSDVSASVSEYNGIEEPDAIMPRASDSFEEIHQHKAINDYKRGRSKASVKPDLSAAE